MNGKSLKKILLLILMIVSKSILSEENIYCFVGDAGEVNPTQKMVVKALANSDCSIVCLLYTSDAADE